MEYKIIIEKTEQALDLLDLKHFLREQKEILDIYYDIQDYLRFSFTEEAQQVQIFIEQYPEIFQDEKYGFYDIFESFNLDDLLSYLKRRYPEILWGYECIERHWIREVR